MGQIFLEPVIASDGQTYEKKGFQEWIKVSQNSPAKNEPLKDLTMTNNVALRKEIQEFHANPPKDDKCIIY